MCGTRNRETTVYITCKYIWVKIIAHFLYKLQYTRGYSAINTKVAIGKGTGLHGHT